MTASRVRPLALVTVLLVGLSVLPAGSGAPVDGGASAPQDESAMGAELSAFMQSSSAEASERVDSGLFVAGYDRADEERRPEIVDDRAASLETRLADLRAERGRLNETYEQYRAEGEAPPPRLRAQLTRLAVQVDTFEDAVDETDERASAVGADTDRIERLRTDARDLSGPEVAEIARGIAGASSPSEPRGLLPGHGPGDSNDTEDSGDTDDPTGPPIDLPEGPITDRGDGFDDSDDTVDDFGDGEDDSGDTEDDGDGWR